MKCYSLMYNDHNGDSHTVVVEAESGTHALTVAMDQYQELKLHPNRITKIYREDCPNGK